MATGLPRTNFSSSRLTRFLADLAVADVPAAKPSFAERLGLWLDWTDAISLSAALNESGRAGPDAAPPPAGDVASEAARLRRDLAASILAEGSIGRSRIPLPAPVPGESLESAADYTDWRHYYLAHQRAMEAGIGPLRARARAALSGRSKDLARLAALDAVMEEALKARRQQLLASVPSLLEKHFQRLYEAHRETLAQTGEPDSPERWWQPAGWLARFCKDMQGALLAELDTRLQPVDGLLEALENKST